MRLHLFQRGLPDLASAIEQVEDSFRKRVTDESHGIR
jgi:hypothetical protein